MKPRGERLLAPWTYTSSELFQLERDELFHCNWMLIGHVSDFLQAGDYRTLDVGNERAIVIHVMSRASFALFTMSVATVVRAWFRALRETVVVRLSAHFMGGHMNSTAG